MTPALRMRTSNVSVLERRIFAASLTEAREPRSHMMTVVGVLGARVFSLVRVSSAFATDLAVK